MTEISFFRYWFRFIWKNLYLKELGRYNIMRDYALRDYEVFSGHALEQYFKWKFIEEQKYTKMDAECPSMVFQFKTCEFST